MSLCLYQEVQANSNLIQCDFVESTAITGCRVSTFTIANDEDFEMSYNLRYKFECRGHASHISLSGDQGDYILKRGSGWQSLLELTSKSEISLKVLDKNFYAKTFLPGCKLVIDSEFTRFPSSNTVTLWHQESAFQAKIVDLTHQIYLQASSFENYINWDDAKTNILLSSVVESKTYYDEICFDFPEDDSSCGAADDFFVLEIVLRNKLRNRPHPFSPDTLDAAVSTVVEHYFNLLMEEKAIGENIQERFIQWNIEISNVLADTLNAIVI